MERLLRCVSEAHHKTYVHSKEHAGETAVLREDANPLGAGAPEARRGEAVTFCDDAHLPHAEIPGGGG